MRWISAVQKDSYYIHKKAITDTKNKHNYTNK